MSDEPEREPEADDAIARWLRAAASDRPSGDLEAKSWRASVSEKLFGTTPAQIHIGRYRVLARIGGGARGVVWAAIDPELDRKVAVKVLHAHEGLQAAREEMVREAKSLARLSHPNVVPVFDAGEHEGHVFVTLEHVSGTTLRGWLEQPHAWREIVAVLVQAGRGLEAAHAAGIVHGDFKPENVLIGDDGRVRVSDFGIARRVEDDDASGAGTPAYMAPEQFLGDALDGRADQFAFCVVLHEALYGERPFAGRDRTALAANVIAGRRRTPSGREVPRWLERALARGLVPDRNARHPDMTVLLRELGRERSRRSWWAAGIAAAGATAAVLAATSLRADADRCNRGASELDTVWNETRAAEIHAAFAATRLPYAEERAERLTAELDHFATSWREVHARACASDEGDTVELGRLYCLHTRLLELDSLVEVMATADPSVVEYATQGGRAPPSPENCIWAAAAPQIAGEPGASHELRATIARARAMGDTGKLQDGLALARHAIDRAQELGDRSLEAEALLVAAEIERVLLGITRDVDPDATMHAALLAAEVAHRPDLVAQAAVGELEVAQMRGEYTHALALESRAREAVAAIGQPPELEGRIDFALATTLWFIDEFDRALGHFDRAYERFEQAGPPSHRWLAMSDNIRGELTFKRGDYVASRPYYERSLALATEIFGPVHQLVANGNGNLGETYFVMGDYEMAGKLFGESLRIRREIFGDTSVWAIHSFAHVGDVALERGEPERALEFYREGLAERLALRPGLERSTSDEVAVISVYRDLQSWSQETWLRNGIAAALLDLGQLDDALEEAERTAAAPLTDEFQHPDLSARIDMRGQVLLALDRPSDAIGEFTRAIEVLDAAYPPEARAYVWPLLGLGRARFALGDAAGALPPLQRSLALLSATPSAYPRTQAATHLALARAYRALARDDDARNHALRAQELLSHFTSGPGARELADVRRVIAEAPRER
ncbi:MAG TPA: serine/threonine-protein kinase [Nannocystaceae bacterium]|nr:serine/threonine-protein kinase [Nannocystaceae bacterium]